MNRQRAPAADRAARKIAALGHVEPAVLQNAVDKIGVIEPEEQGAEEPDLF